MGVPFFAYDCFAQPSAGRTAASAISAAAATAADILGPRDRRLATGPAVVAVPSRHAQQLPPVLARGAAVRAAGRTAGAADAPVLAHGQAVLLGDPDEA